MIRKTITKALEKVTGIKKIQLDVPENEEFGDYSSNIALQSFQQVVTGRPGVKVRKHPSRISGESPREFAENIVEILKKDEELSKIIEKIEIAGPGFINFFLKQSVLIDELQKLLKEGDSYGKSDLLKGKRIMFEYGQPNTHKLPHIGHLFSYIFGESMTRFLAMAGAETYRANYQGDVGPHVAKCIWTYLKENPAVPESSEEKVKLLQEMYQKGSQAYEENENAKKEIDELNQKIYAKDEDVMNVWKETRSWSTDYYRKFEKRLDINYDRYYFESEVYEHGLIIVKENIGKIFKESQGAVIFEGSKFGLHDRVFLTSNQTPTYEAKDLYLQTLKYKEWPYDLLIISTAHEQNEYFKVIFKALEKLSPNLKGKLKHIGFGMVNLKTGKMSSRTGEFIGAVELVDKVIGTISEIVEKNEKMNMEEKRKVTEIVGIGAIKYSFLKNNPLQDTKFDIEESISKEGNSGPYLQYTLARANSVLSKVSGYKLEAGEKLDLNHEELALMRTFVRFPGIIVDVAKNYSPNLLCTYLFELAQKYNTFYNMHAIVGSKEEKIRLALTQATKQILQNGLKLLAIDTPERM